MCAHTHRVTYCFSIRGRKDVMISTTCPSMRSPILPMRINTVKSTTLGFSLLFQGHHYHSKSVTMNFCNNQRELWYRENAKSMRYGRGLLRLRNNKLAHVLCKPVARSPSYRHYTNKLRHSQSNLNFLRTIRRKIYRSLGLLSWPLDSFLLLWSNDSEDFILFG
jgi:hypothetical protein